MTAAIIHITITATPDKAGIGKSTVAHIIGYALQQQGINVTVEDDNHIYREFNQSQIGMVNRAIESRVFVVENHAAFETPSLRAKRNGEMFIRE